MDPEEVSTLKEILKELKTLNDTVKWLRGDTQDIRRDVSSIQHNDARR